MIETPRNQAAIVRRSKHLRTVLRLVLLTAGLVGAGLVCGACYPKAGPPPGALSANSVTTATARWPGVTAATLQGGHDLFLANCNGCHSYPDLTAIAEDEWPSILEKMAKKSHLNGDERDAVLHFVLASRAEHAAR
jgi:mono/diheme cytochrome c family protein